MKIYASYGAPPFLKGMVRDIRPVWALEEIGAAYDIHWLNVKEGEQRSDAYRLVHPFGKIPAMEDEGLTLFESGAILEYIANKYGALGGPSSAPHWPHVVQWCYAALDTVAPPMFDSFVWENFRKDHPVCAEVTEIARTNANARLDVLDGVLAGKDFLVGGEMTIADVLMGTALRNALFPDILGDHGNVRRYLEGLVARRAFKRAFELNSKGPA